MNIEIWCDGSAFPNPGEVGAAAVLVAKEGDRILKESIISIYTAKGTNQVAEILAAVIGLSALKRQSEVTVYTDSQYVVKTMNGEYKRRANLEFWKLLDAAINQQNHQVTWVWVRGHVGNKYNEMAHEAANKAIARKRGTVTL